MNAKQYAWAYVIRSGKCDVKPGYYGGYQPAVYNTKLPTHSNPFKADWNDPYLAKIKEIGIDWDKTQSPRTEDFSVFEGTECDSGREEKLSGTLVLKNGDTQYWHSEPPLSDIFELMASRDVLIDFARDTMNTV